MQARIRSSALVFVFVAACICSCDRNEPKQYYNTADPNVKTHRGVTYLKTAPITGVVFTLNDLNDTLVVASYTDGKLDGVERQYWNKDQIRSIRHFTRGWKTGEHRGWYANGKPSFIYNFADDMFQGNQKEWLESGLLYSDLNFERGSESGLQRIWYTDGTIKANYIVKNNRRYGLLGTKNCTNTADSVLNKL